MFSAENGQTVHRLSSFNDRKQALIEGHCSKTVKLVEKSMRTYFRNGNLRDNSRPCSEVHRTVLAHS